MFVTLSAAGLLFGVQGMIAPELDFASLLNPDQRAKVFSIDFAFRLASGTELEATDGGAQAGILALGTPQEVADWAALYFGRQGIGYRQDRTKITLFDVRGDRITGIRVWCWTGRKEERKFVPQLAYQWVLRAPPKYTWATLGPAPHSGSPLARMASGLLGGTVAAVAAPEIDFSALPETCEEPRVLHLWVYPRLASGAVKVIRSESYSGGTPRAVRHEILTYFEHLYEMRVADDGRVALLRRIKATDTGPVVYDPVVGLAVRSNGPVPALRWTWRPGVRDQFRGVRRK